MRITKFIDVQTEIEIDLSIDDIHGILCEPDSNLNKILDRINSFGTFFKGIPDSKIKEMTVPQRVAIVGFLREQIERFDG